MEIVGEQGTMVVVNTITEHLNPWFLVLLEKQGYGQENLKVFSYNHSKPRSNLSIHKLVTKIFCKDTKV